MPQSGQSGKKPKPTHYKIVCISLYVEDIARLDELVAELKRRGHTKANKSQVIRAALEQIERDVHLRELPPASVVVREGEAGSSLFIVVAGLLEASIQNQAAETRVVGKLSPAAEALSTLSIASTRS